MVRKSLRMGRHPSIGKSSLGAWKMTPPLARWASMVLITERTSRMGLAYLGRGGMSLFCPQHFLNFLPLPQGHGAFRPMRTPAAAGTAGRRTATGTGRGPGPDPGPARLPSSGGIVQGSERSRCAARAEARSAAGP